jgi:hypothetical protein
MRIHILNGDALKESFPFDSIAGEVIVIREAFMDGPVSDVYDAAYWTKRKNYIQNTYGESEHNYDDRVRSEFNRLEEITGDDEVYLWFEDDLFCQCNMWFAVHFISQKSEPVFYRVYPEADTERWMGFGRTTKEDLIQYFNKAIKLNKKETEHIERLWEAFVADDRETLVELSETGCGGIRFQKEVVQALLDRVPDETGQGRPQKTLSALLMEGDQSFYDIFEKFAQREGIYGFGDTQVAHMLKELENQ